MIECDKEIYLNASEAARFIGIPRHLFYTNVRPSVKAHLVKSRKQLHYKRSDLQQFQGVIPALAAS